jgi:hypothetical protein
MSEIIEAQTSDDGSIVDVQFAFFRGLAGFKPSSGEIAFVGSPPRRLPAIGTIDNQPFTAVRAWPSPAVPSMAVVLVEPVGGNDTGADTEG